MNQDSSFRQSFAAKQAEIARIEPQGGIELFDISSLFRAIWRNIWLLVVPTVLFAALGLYYGFNVATPYFRATAVVELETRDADILNLQTIARGIEDLDPVTVSTEIAIIQSEPMLAAVVDALGLLDDPEFNPTLGVDLDALSPEDRQTLSSITGPRTIAALRAALEVRQVHGTALFSLSALTTDPKKSADIANALADTYLDRQRARKVEVTQQATQWLRTRVAELQVQLTEAESEIENFRFQENDETQLADTVELERLTRNAQAIRDLYQHFLARLQETSAQEGLHTADGNVLTYAIAPLEPALPAKKFILMVATVFGGLVGLVLIAIREVLKRGIRSTEDLEKLSHHPVLGMTPKLGVRQRGRLEDVLADGAGSTFARAVENLRTSLLLNPDCRSGNAIALTSSTLDEGKTTTAIALAHSFASAGYRVLLIDGDLRQPSVTQALANGASTGFVAAIHDADGGLSAHVQPVSLGFDVLPCEQTVERPVDLLQSQACLDLITGAKQDYDLVFIDTPPVLAAPDARALASVIDRAVLIVRFGKTDGEMAKASIQKLEASQISIVGKVMTQTPLREFRDSNYGVSTLDY